MRRLILTLVALCVLCSGARAQVGNYNAIAAVTATPNSSSHAAGTSVGGLFVVPIARTPGGSGELTDIFWKSTGGSTGVLVIRIWQWKPTSTTCADQTAFAGSDTDDVYLISPPFSITPAAPGNTTGDSATYGSSLNVRLPFTNSDSTVSGFNNTAISQNLYVCAITVATDTADESAKVRLTLSARQN